MVVRGRGFFVWILSVVAVGVLSALSVVPMPVLTAAGAALGTLYYHVDGRRKRIALSNLRLVFGEEKTEDEIRRILKAAYRHLGRALLEFAGLPRLTPEKLARLARTEAVEKIGRALQAGRGVVLLTAHFGNWELLAQIAAMNGYPIHIIGREANVGLLHRYIIGRRESHGNRVIVKQRAMRKVLSALKNGETVGLLCDQRGSSQGLLIDFLGHPAPTNTDVARLILKSGATVMTAFLVRRPDKTHLLHVSDPMVFESTGDRETDVFNVTQQYMQALESFIRRYPEQWLWMHRRWMRRNHGAVE
jgi:KDO2-lipid IV(A) lauroyltransferase